MSTATLTPTAGAQRHTVHSGAAQVTIDIVDRDTLPTGTDHFTLHKCGSTGEPFYAVTYRQQHTLGRYRYWSTETLLDWSETPTCHPHDRRAAAGVRHIVGGLDDMLAAVANLVADTHIVIYDPNRNQPRHG